MKLFYLAIIITLFSIKTNAGGDSTLIVDNLYNDVKTGVIKSFSFFTSPLEFTEDDWMFASAITAGSLLMFAFDEQLETSEPTIFNRNQLFQKIINYSGDVDYANIFSIGLYTAGLLAGDDAVRVTGRLLVESLFISGSTALLLRLLTGRPRPYMDQNSSMQWFETDLDYQSFPSGHTTVVFAVSTILAERIDNDWARAGIYGLASVAAIERIYSDQHWFSDVVIGGLLGYGSASFVLSKEEENNSKSPFGKLSFFPSPGGINLLWRF